MKGPVQRERHGAIAALALAVLINRFMTGGVIDCDGGIRLGG